MHVAREVERRISAAAAAEEKARRPPTSEAAMLSFILVIGSGRSWEEMSGYCFLRSIGLRKVRMVKTGSVRFKCRLLLFLYTDGREL